jgi:uncharacterized protein (TIGR02145 family)
LNLEKNKTIEAISIFGIFIILIIYSTENITKLFIMKMEKKILVYPIGLLLTGLILFVSCKKKSQVVLPSLTTATISTASISSITPTSAFSGGNVSSDGGANVTERGICYSTIANPDITNTKIVNGSGTGSFTSNISGLAGATTYFVRSYATNSVGTAYGNQASFTTTSYFIQGTGLNDLDGNTYTSVILGTQEWMVGNLKTSKYNDGTTIPLVTDGTIWGNLTTPAYCWYNNDISTYKNTYGALYNWYTVNTGKLCPTGWHIPTEAEWTVLENYLGGSAAGGKLKETGTTHWLSPNIGATNESGFTGLPGGNRYSLGTFAEIGSGGYWWGSTENSYGSAFGLSLHRDDIYIIISYYGDKSNGMSVRCVRD